MDERERLFAGLSDGQGDSGLAGTLRLGRIHGIAIGIHYTWLIAFALITYSLALGLFPVLIPGLATGAYWLLGASAAVLLFASVLVHELSHSLVAQARGLPVSSITLFVFGGVSNIQTEPEDPGQEFLMAVVGPVSSLILAGIFWALFTIIAAPAPVQALLFYLAVVNLILGVFNLLPGFPLDGGRVLRAIIWGITGNLGQATNWATGIGQVFAFLLIIWGVFQIFGGNFLGGLWTAFIGWFLNNAAEESRRQVIARETFRGVRVRDVMAPNPPVVSPTLPVRDLIEEYAIRRGTRALLVASDDQLVGIVTLADLHKLPHDTWNEATVGQIMTRGPLVTTSPNVDLQSALRLMGERDLNQLPVIADGRLVGMLTRSGVIRYLQLRDELGVPPSAAEEERRRAA